ncbi:MAG TPA: SOS response-associated peptidase [Thermoanaerobaculia bacterium]|nr:SOS response-associated peptidase [Thermoanaerobaculia bacterium]
MCGRYTLSTPGDLVAAALALDEVPQLAPRYNIAPTDEAAVVRLGDDGRRRLYRLRWGLVPRYADDPAVGSRLINARSESAADKPAFRDSFRQRRCLVPADGFFEWRPMAAGKQPFHLRLPTRRPFSFAGLWSWWQAAGEAPLETFTILTCPPCPTVAPLHDRMPVMLPPEAQAAWLDPLAGRERLQALLAPWAGELEAVPVSRYVNTAGNEGLRCVEPVALESPPPGAQRSLFG